MVFEFSLEKMKDNYHANNMSKTGSELDVKLG